MTPRGAEETEMNSTTNNPFQSHADEYEAWFDEHKYTYLSELELFQSLIPKNKLGLEIGVGTGRFAIPLDVTYGIDASTEMINIAKKNGLKNASMAQAEKLPFDSNLFDYVLLTTTICFLEDFDTVFTEMRRVLKDNGVLIMGFVDKDSFLGQNYLQKKDKSTFYATAKFYSVTEIIEILHKYNFEEFQIKQTLFSLPEKITKIEPIKDHYGDGGFVALIANKKTLEVK